jgi:hypothetical protein
MLFSFYKFKILLQEKKNLYPLDVIEKQDSTSRYHEQVHELEQFF